MIEDVFVPDDVCDVYYTWRFQLWWIGHARYDCCGKVKYGVADP